MRYRALHVAPVQALEAADGRSVPDSLWRLFLLTITLELKKFLFWTRAGPFWTPDCTSPHSTSPDCTSPDCTSPDCPDSEFLVGLGATERTVLKYSIL